MNYWSPWVSGAALASIMVFHASMTGRMMGVSGRITALVNRLSGRSSSVPEMSSAELLAALASVSAEEFGSAPDTATSPSQNSTMSSVALPRTTSPINHASFLSALLVGGFVAALLKGTFALSFLASAREEFFINSSLSARVLTLFGGGILVGFGTRMAGGCTSGHGLCGVSRAQPGSLLATSAFFAAGIAMSFAWELL